MTFTVGARPHTAAWWGGVWASTPLASGAAWRDDHLDSPLDLFLCHPSEGSRCMWARVQSGFPIWLLLMGGGGAGFSAWCLGEGGSYLPEGFLVH